MKHPRLPKFPWWLTVMTYVFMLISLNLASRLYVMRARVVSAPPQVVVTEEVEVVATPTPTLTPIPTPELPVLKEGQLPEVVNDGQSELVLTGQWFRSDTRVILRQPNRETEFAGTVVNPEGTEARITIPANYPTGEYSALLVSSEYSMDKAPSMIVRILAAEPTEFAGWRCEFHARGDFSGIPAFVQDVPEKMPLKFFYDYGQSPTDGYAVLPDEGFGIRCVIERDFESGLYLFDVTKLDDNVWVWVDSNPEPVIAAALHAGVDERTGNVELAQGKHHIRLEFSEGSGLAELEFGWKFIRRLPNRTPTPTPVPPQQEVTP